MQMSLTSSFIKFKAPTPSRAANYCSKIVQTHFPLHVRLWNHKKTLFSQVRQMLAGTRVASTVGEKDGCGSLVETDSQSVSHPILLCFLIGTHPRHHPNQKWQPVLCLLSFLWLLDDDEVFERLMARILNDSDIPCQETQQTGKGYSTQGKRKGRGFAESSLSSLPLRSLLWVLLRRVDRHPCIPACLVTLWVTWDHSVFRWSGKN